MQPFISIYIYNTLLEATHSYFSPELLLEVIKLIVDDVKNRPAGRQAVMAEVIIKYKYQLAQHHY